MTVTTWSVVDQNGMHLLFARPLTRRVARMWANEKNAETGPRWWKGPAVVVRLTGTLPAKPTKRRKP